MKVLSLFSGVGGFDMGLEAAGMTTAFQCEIDKHARSVLDYHWPDVPKWDDVSTLTGAYILEQTGGVDLVAWGSPCQDLSLAGKRAGLSGERSGLFHEGIRIIKELRELSNGKSPTWSIWENVYGALSSNRGADFGQVLFEMDEAGACFSEWAVLDAQYFGVPQRRRRVFVASCFDPRISERCGSPLFPVSESVSRYLAPRITQRENTSTEATDSVGTGGELGTGKDIANTIGASLYHHGTVVNQDANNGHLVVESDTGLTMSFDAYNHTTNDVMHTIRQRTHKGDDLVVQPVAYPIQDGRDIEKNQNGLGVAENGEPSYTLDRTGGQAVAYSIREDAKANNFSATEIETARALQALQPSVQSHHAQTFITQPLLLDGRRVDDVRVYTEPVQTLQERMGTGGNNVPVVAQEQDPIVFSHTQGLDAQPSTEYSPTLRTEGNGMAVAQEKSIVIDRSAFNTGFDFDRDPGIEVSDTTPTLVARGPHAVGQETYVKSRRAQTSEDVETWVESDVTPTLNVFDVGDTRTTTAIIGTDIVGSLAARDFKGVGNQYVAENKLVVEQPGAISYDGYNQTIEEDIHRSWRIGRDSSDFVVDLREPTLIVRRLTPLECERLMGWPDNHTAVGVNGTISDTNRYKMCGNGVASPVAEWIAKHILANG